MEPPRLTIDLLLLILTASGLICVASLWACLHFRWRSAYLQWSIGGFLVSLATLLMFVRQTVPDLLSILVANLALIAGYGALAAGTLAWAGTPRRWPHALAAGFALLFGGAWLLDADMSARIVVVSLMLSAFYLLMGVTFADQWQRGRRGIGVALAMLGLPVLSVLAAIRALTNARVLPDFMWPALFDALALALGVAGSLAIATTLVRIGLSAQGWRRQISPDASLKAPQDAAAAIELPDTPVPGTWQLARARCALITPEGVELRLTGKEYLVLLELGNGEETPVPRETLNALIGRDVANPKDRGVDIMISRLRRKCSDAGASLPITSVRGRGYIFHGVLSAA